MNKVLIVLMFILLGTSLIVVSNMNKGVENSFTIEYKNNKNIALPDLNGKQEILPNVFRLYDSNGVTFDYNLGTGIYTFNGTSNAYIDDIIIYINAGTQYTISYIAISGTLTGGGLNIYINSPIINVIQQINQNIDKQNTFATTTQTQLSFNISVGRTFTNYQFKLQLEKGEIATAYVVPKLIPVYKDNLTQQEKNEIGIGAFGGISKILKTINDIIKPVGDFINGLLNMF